MTLKDKIFCSLIYFVPEIARNKIKNIPIIAPLQRFVIEYLSPKIPFLHQIDAGPAKGLKMLIHLPSDKNMWKGTYELDFCKRLQQNVKSSDICYDIGAFHGYTAGVLALAGASKVYAFEPMPENQCVIENVVSFNPKLKLDLIKAAVSDKDGEQILQIHTDRSMNSLSVTAETFSNKKIRVKTVTVDSHAKKTGFWPTLIKIDVEGAEELVLQGAEQALEKSVRLVFMEIHNATAETRCRKTLENLGFVCIWKEHSWGYFANQTMFVKKRAV